MLNTYYDCKVMTLRFGLEFDRFYVSANGTNLRVHGDCFGGNNEAMSGVGDIVTFVFASYDKFGNPTSPQILRVRYDLTWQDDFDLETKLPLTGTVYGDFSRHPKLILWQGVQRKQTRNAPEAKPRGHWTMDDNANMRMYFDEFARRKNLDPLVPETWYSNSCENFRDTEV